MANIDSFFITFSFVKNYQKSYLIVRFVIFIILYTYNNYNSNYNSSICHYFIDKYYYHKMITNFSISLHKTALHFRIIEKYIKNKKNFVSKVNISLYS